MRTLPIWRLQAINSAAEACYGGGRPASALFQECDSGIIKGDARRAGPPGDWALGGAEAERSWPTYAN